MIYMKPEYEMLTKEASKKPSICFVAPYLFPVLAADYAAKTVGGAEVQQNFIARGLLARDYSVSVVVNDFGQPDEMLIAGIRVIKIKLSNKGLPFIRFFHPVMTHLWQALKIADAEVYYQRGAGWLTGLVGQFCRSYKRRFIYSVAHDLDLDKDKAWALFPYSMAWRAYYLFQHGLHCADKIVVQNVLQEKICENNYGRPAKLIPSCFEANQQYSREDSCFVLWVGVLRQWKRPELFLELAQNLPNITFQMIGGADVGAQGQALYSKIEADADKCANIEFKGFLPFAEADKYIAQAKVFVNTSDYEGFPNTFLQSWARGVPTVSFVDCGARDESGAISLIVNSMQQMQVLIQRLVSDEEFWRQESLRCRQYFAQHHSVSSVITHYEELMNTFRSENTQVMDKL